MNSYEDINRVHEALNNFHKNIQFTVDKFEKEIPHCFDIEIAPDGLSVYHKQTQSWQYTHFNLNLRGFLLWFIARSQYVHQES